jgi:type I restriction enzyme M protein
MLASKRRRPWTLSSRDKLSLEISWIPDESLEDSASLPDPDEIAAEIVEDLRVALAEFEAIQEEMSPTPSG